MIDITKPERPVKELLILFRSRGSKSCIAVSGGRDLFWFSLVVRRSTLTRDAILSEPEVSSVGKFRFFRLGPSVIESTVLETSSTDDFTIDACVLDPFWIAEMFLECAT